MKLSAQRLQQLANARAVKAKLEAARKKTGNGHAASVKAKEAVWAGTAADNLKDIAIRLFLSGQDEDAIIVRDALRRMEDR